MTLTHYDIHQPHFNQAWSINDSLSDEPVEILIHYSDYGYSKADDEFFPWSELKSRLAYYESDKRFSVVKFGEVK